VAFENPSIQTHLVLLCCIKYLCIFGLLSSLVSDYVILRAVTDFESVENLNPLDLQTRFLSDLDLITDSGR